MLLKFRITGNARTKENYNKMRMMFWNTNRNENINFMIANLVRDCKIDVLVLAEYVADVEELKDLFQEYDQCLTKCNTVGCDRISIWSSYVNIKPGIQNKYYSIQIFLDKFILCGVHLITDLHGDRSEDRFAIIQGIKDDLECMENEVHSYKTIIIGDMNEMPYDKGCLNANGFHGLPVLEVGDRETRVVNQKEYRKFYNPMWNFMGDFTYPPGTYYLNEAKITSPMWYLLDQVIISKDVLPLFNKEELKIITSSTGGDLMDEKGHPNKKISDHFPIMCEILS